MSGTIVVRPASLLSMLEADVNPILSIGVLHGGRCPDEPAFVVSEENGGVHSRVAATLRYIERLHRMRPAAQGPARDRTLTLFQAEDAPRDAEGVSWQAKTAWTGVRLVPDLYYFTNDGYERFLPPGLYDLPPWERRKDIAVWRGSTSGMLGLTSSSIETLPRVRLCRLMHSLGLNCDAAITGVVQAVSEDEKASIEAMLVSERLLKDFVSLREMGFYKLVIDIDGNASSWNFLAKLKLGSCVVKVESDWCQWFTARLMPWRHYVPVTADLADLGEKLDWCFSHDEEAEQIAQAGREFALGFSLDRELAKASRTIFQAPASPGSERQET